MGGKARLVDSRRVAFLRGMNLGRRRITNEELCAAFAAMGYNNVHAFLASGNVIFDARQEPAELERSIAQGLERSLGYAVPTFVRTGDQVRGIAARAAFSDSLVQATAGKVQVILLSRPVSTSIPRVLALSTANDSLALHGSELYWLPRWGVSDTELDMNAIEAILGPTTTRTKRTIERIGANFLI